MKVLHINTVFKKGGAGIISILIAENLKNKGAESSFIEHLDVLEFTKKYSPFPGYKKMSRYFGIERIKSFLERNGYINLFLPVENKYIGQKIDELKPDIIHLHNVHGGFFPIGLLRKLDKYPIIWTFHDMFNFTGHCAYSFDCDRWKSGCGECPYLDIYPSVNKDQTGFLWKYKKNVYDSINFSIVVPSMWLHKCVKDSMLKNKDIRLIYNGIDTDIFKKTEKREARQRLKLPSDKKIILFIAHGGKDNQFKGGNFFSRVVDRYKDHSEVYFVCVGGQTETGNESNVNNYGYVSNQKELALLYSASDIYFFPTRADNCPLSVLEAMACECPVVTFNVGGVPELVEHMESGYVADYGNEDDLTKGIEILLSNNQMNEMGLNVRKRIEEQFSLDKMCQSYLDLYKEVIKK